MEACGTSYHGLVDRVGGLVRKDAGGQAGDHPDHVDLMRRLQHVVVDGDVVSLERRAAARERSKRRVGISSREKSELQLRFHDAWDCVKLEYPSKKPETETAKL